MLTLKYFTDFSDVYSDIQQYHLKYFTLSTFRLLCLTSTIW